MKTRKQIEDRKKDLDDYLRLEQIGLVDSNRAKRVRILKELEVLEWVLKGLDNQEEKDGIQKM